MLPNSSGAKICMAMISINEQATLHIATPHNKTTKP